MLDDNWKKFIDKAREDYEKIGSLVCPAFNNEKVIFNMYGFKHLIWKGRVVRTRREQVERVALLPLVINILRKSNRIYSHKEVFLGNSKACFWAIKGFEQGKNLRVVIRKKNNGLLHFFSVMEE